MKREEIEYETKKREKKDFRLRGNARRETTSTQIKENL